MSLIAIIEKWKELFAVRTSQRRDVVVLRTSRRAVVTSHRKEIVAHAVTKTNVRRIG